MNKKMSQILCLIAALCFIITATGCSRNEIQEQTTDNDKIKIVCTVYPAYEWIMQILGERSDDFEITWLLSKGTDIHNYQPSVDDIAKIKQSDLFIYVGGESDDWVEDVLAQGMSKDNRVVVLMESEDLTLHEETSDGIIQDDGHDHDEDDHDHELEDHDDEGQAIPEYDEHVWLSIKNAQVIVNELEKQVTELTGDTTGYYEENATAYNQKLIELDQKYSQVVQEAETDTLIFADRFPFRYMAEDYGLKYYAAFSGCSAETEASFETLISLAEKVNTLDIHYLITIDGSDETLANTVISITDTKNQGILQMDSLQAVTEEERKNGLTYIQVMENNLVILEKALN